MNKEDTLKQICKMISSGDIPKVVYDKYLSKTQLGFMNYEELYDFLNEQNKKYKEVIDKAIEYLTSYSSIHTIQFGTENDSLNDIELNKTLDEKTLNEMTNRYLKVHDKLLEILKEVE